MRRGVLRLRYVVALASLTSCSEQPLLFSSAETYGVGISVSTASSNPLDLTLGYRSIDASFVPVTSFDRSGVYHAIRGCYNTAIGSRQAAVCSTETGTGAVQQRQHEDGTSTLQPTARLAIRPGQVRVLDTLAAAPIISPPAAPSGGGTSARALPIQSDGANGSVSGTPIDQSQGMINSLSVFSSFNAKAGASGSTITGVGADVGLGKVFATGVAAQQLTEGQNYYLQYAGQALINSVAACLERLTKALGAGNVKSTDAQICSRTSAGGG